MSEEINPLNELAQMVDHRLYKWVAAISGDTPITGCMLMQNPYNGVVVDFGQVEILGDQAINFQWRIIDQAQCTEDLSTNNIVFTKYLERVVIDRLKEIGETNDVVEEDSISDSGTD